jgi:hypothetical protein
LIDEPFAEISPNRSCAVATRHLLETVINQLYSGPGRRSLETTLNICGTRVMANVFLARDQTECARPLDYGQLFRRLLHLTEHNTLDDVIRAARCNRYFYALLRGVGHEVKLRMLEQVHDAINLGEEVQNSTFMLITCVNDNFARSSGRSADWVRQAAT